LRTKKKIVDIKRPGKDVRIDKEQPKFKEVLKSFVKKRSDTDKN